MADFRQKKKATSDDREEKVWQLRIKGWSQQSIADELGIGQSTVVACLKRAANKHHERFMSDINEYKKQQASVIETAAYNALHQYYSSQKQLQIIRKSGKTKNGELKDGSQVSIEKIDQYGDAKLLNCFFKGMEEVRKIWGMDAVTVKSGDKALENMTVDDKIALFTSIPIEERLKLVSAMLTTKPVFDDNSQSDP